MYRYIDQALQGPLKLNCADWTNYMYVCKHVEAISIVALTKITVLWRAKHNNCLCPCVCTLL